MNASQQPTTAQSLGPLLKSARDIMRKDKGLNGDLDRLPLLTWIMFLKFLDDLELQREGEAQLTTKKFKPAIEPPYRWRDWAANSDGITGDELLAFINNEESRDRRRVGCLASRHPRSRLQRGIVNRATASGPKARHVKAWAGVRVANGGPGNSSQKSPRGLKSRNHLASPVPPFQGGEDLFRMFTWGFTPGYHMTGFQPSKQRRIVAELDVLQSRECGLKRLPAETAGRQGLHAPLDALLPAILDRAFKGES